MKNLIISINLVLTIVLFFSTAVVAEGSHKQNVSEIVSASLNNKYPSAKLKSWKQKDGLFIAKINLDGHKYFASFDGQGKWISTVSNIKWEWDLPHNIKQAYNKSGYGSWNVYFAKRVEAPCGVSYQLLVDNANLNQMLFTEGLLTTDKLLEFKADGLLISVKNVTDDPMP